MINYVWTFFIIISVIYGICFGNIYNVNASIFKSTEEAVNLSIKLLGTICLWNGMMKIAQQTSIIKGLKKIIKPLLKFLFPQINEKEYVYTEISMNVVANLMGLGNAATPAGLKAMKLLQKRNKNKERLSNEMGIFIVLNTASIQIIPTTVIAIRNFLGSDNPTAILFPVWVATICAAIAAITAAKIILKKYNLK